MHSGAAIAFRDVPATASHGTAHKVYEGSGRFGRQAAEEPLSSGQAGKQPGCRVCIGGGALPRCAVLYRLRHAV